MRWQYSNQKGWQLRGARVSGLGWPSEPDESSLTPAEAKALELQAVRAELTRVKSLRPIPVLRSHQRIVRFEQRLERRLAELLHELDLLEA